MKMGILSQNKKNFGVKHVILSQTRRIQGESCPSPAANGAFWGKTQHFGFTLEHFGGNLVFQLQAFPCRGGGRCHGGGSLLLGGVTAMGGEGFNTMKGGSPPWGGCVSLP